MLFASECGVAALDGSVVLGTARTVVGGSESLQGSCRCDGAISRRRRHLRSVNYALPRVFLHSVPENVFQYPNICFDGLGESEGKRHRVARPMIPLGTRGDCERSPFGLRGGSTILDASNSRARVPPVFDCEIPNRLLLL